MSRFWDAATEQAGREFGYRHYRWFAGARIFGRLAPTIATLIILAAVVAAGSWLYSAIDPDWAAIGDRIAGSAGLVALWLAGAALGAILAVTLIVFVRRAWWGWWHLSRPTWWRRY